MNASVNNSTNNGKFREFDIITFMDEPTLQQVIDTVDEKIVEYAHELTDSDLDALFEKEAS